MEEKQPETRSSIQVIDRMMNLLDAIAAQPAPANLKLLAQATQLHPSTAHRILNVMVRNRMVDRGPRKRANNRLPQRVEPAVVHSKNP